MVSFYSVFVHRTNLHNKDIFTYQSPQDGFVWDALTIISASIRHEKESYTPSFYPVVTAFPICVKMQSQHGASYTLVTALSVSPHRENVLWLVSMLDEASLHVTIAVPDMQTKHTSVIPQLFRVFAGQSKLLTMRLHTGHRKYILVD